MEFTFSYKNIKNTSTSRTIHTEHLLNADRRPQTSERARKPPRNWVGQRKKKTKGIGTGPVPQGGSCEGGKVPALWKVSSPAGRSA